MPHTIRKVQAPIVIETAESYEDRLSADLIQAFLEIPQDGIESSLHLGENNFSLFNFAKTLEALALIPLAIKKLIIPYTAIQDFSPDELAQFLKAIPETVEDIDMSKNALGDLTEPEVYSVCSSFPKQLKQLDLSCNSLNDWLPVDFQKVLAEHITPITLLLNKNKLGYRASDKLAVIFANLSERIRYLHLAGNDLGEHADTAICTIKAIRGNVEYLDLTDNGLGLLNQEQLIEAVSSLSDKLISLRLRNNKLDSSTGLAEALTKLPLGLNRLDLASNNLGNKPIDVLVNTLSLIPKNIVFLDLSLNRFIKLSGENLSRMFANLSSGIIHLNIAYNDLEFKNTEVLIAAFRSFPPTMNELTLSSVDLFERTDEELHAMGNALPYIATLNLVDDHGRPILHHPKLDAFTRHMGSQLREAYISAIENHLIQDVSEICLSYLMANGIAFFPACAEEIKLNSVCDSSPNF